MDFITKLVEFFENISMKKGIILIVIMVIIIACFPLIDYYFYFNLRISNRIEVLEKLTSLNYDVIQKNPIMLEEYNAILSEVKLHGQGLDLNMDNIISTKSDQQTNLYKFLSGGFWGWLIVVLAPFIYKKNLKDIFIAVFLFGLFGALLGWISTLIPTFANTNINYIGFPLLQLLIGIILGVYFNRKKNETTA